MTSARKKEKKKSDKVTNTSAAEEATVRAAESGWESDVGFGVDRIQRQQPLGLGRLFSQDQRCVCAGVRTCVHNIYIAI